jgi:hypothetical protein
MLARYPAIGTGVTSAPLSIFWAGRDVSHIRIGSTNHIEAGGNRAEAG